MATRRQQKASATLSTAMATVATETHSDARWWPLTRGEAGECSWKGRLGWGIWGIIWRLTKPLASWGGGQEIERVRGSWRKGHRGEGSGEKERAPFSSCPLQREWPLTLCISLKSVYPPPLASPPSLAGAQGPSSCLSRSGHSSSSAVHCRVERKKADREKVGSWGGGFRGGLGHMPPPVGLERLHGERHHSALIS